MSSVTGEHGVVAASESEIGARADVEEHAKQ
jgi:hypothetical protein